MRIPHVHKLQTVNAETPSVEVKVDVHPEAYIDDLGLFEDKKEYIKFIIRLKMMIRNSFEYTEAISFLKRKHGMDHCGIHPNASMDNGFRIELHHTPLVLEDVCNTVIKKRLDRKESLKMSDIADEVVELHYLDLIGLYPLCELCHHFAHSGPGDELFIPMENVYGSPLEFANIYGQYMPESLKTKWDNVVLLNKSYTMIAANLPLSLQKQYIYIDSGDKKDVPDGISTSKLVGFINRLNETNG